MFDILTTLDKPTSIAIIHELYYTIRSSKETGVFVIRDGELDDAEMKIFSGILAKLDPTSADNAEQYIIELDKVFDRITGFKLKTTEQSNNSLVISDDSALDIVISGVSSGKGAAMSSRYGRRLRTYQLAFSGKGVTSVNHKISIIDVMLSSSNAVRVTKAAINQNNVVSFFFKISAKDMPVLKKNLHAFLPANVTRSESTNPVLTEQV